MPFGKVYHGKEEFLELLASIGDYLAVSRIALHYLIAAGDRVAGCVGIPDVKTGELVEVLEQLTFRDGKAVEVKLFYHDAGTMVEKPTG